MIKAIDAFNNQLVIGHYIYYTVRSGSNVQPRYAKIIDILYNPTAYNAYRLVVKAVAYKYNGKQGNYVLDLLKNGKPITISSNETLIRIITPPASIIGMLAHL